MPVDQIEEPMASRPADVQAAKQNGAGDENAQGRNRSLLFAAILGAFILIGVVAFWLYARTYESTDDAQVDGHLNGVTSRVDGVIKAVYVEENQSVQAGQLIAEIGSPRLSSRAGAGAGAIAESPGGRCARKIRIFQSRKVLRGRAFRPANRKSPMPRQAVAGSRARSGGGAIALAGS